MQAEWFNVKALQDLQQKIQQKKEKAVDTGPSVILGEAPWGRYGDRNRRRMHAISLSCASAVTFRPRIYFKGTRH
jgi:hypothetical protein